MSNLKLNNVLAIGEDTFIIRMTFGELKNLVDSKAIQIDLNKEVPYVPLEDEGVIYLNIDKDSISFNNENKELTANDKFRVLDGEIRLLNFIKNIDWYNDKMDKIVTLNIVTYNVELLKNLMLNVTTNGTRKTASNEKIPINMDSINEIANNIMTYGSDLNEEMNNWVEKNNGDGYHRIKALVDSYKNLGKTNQEIVNILKKLDV
jgi:hypothetical protein